MKQSLEHIINTLYENDIITIKSIITNKTPFWQEIISLHHADLADIIEHLNNPKNFTLFINLSSELQADVFVECSDDLRRELFLACKPQEREILLKHLTMDELVDFFDDLSDEEVTKYIKFINKKSRETILSRLEFPKDSAGDIMDTDIFVLPSQMQVHNAIALLQKLANNAFLNRVIYIVDKKQILLGYILLEDLVLHKPNDLINMFIKKIQYKINVHDDKEDIAIYMLHYKIELAPVIGEKNTLLGVITAKKIAEIVESEASEDIYRMASLAPIKTNYFEESFFVLVWKRGAVLILLLLLQSISTFIIGKYQNLLIGFLVIYIGMITSTGGNTSGQVSVLAIQGFATGELRINQLKRFLKREFYISCILGLLLAIIAFIRIYFSSHIIHDSIIVALSLFIVVIVSTLLGAIMPFALRKLSIDPAYSAGPVLATCMDIIGVLLFILTTSLLLPLLLKTT